MATARALTASELNAKLISFGFKPNQGIKIENDNNYNADRIIFGENTKNGDSSLGLYIFKPMKGYTDCGNLYCVCWYSKCKAAHKHEIVKLIEKSLNIKII